MNILLLPQPKGEIDDSQAVNAYNASMVLSGEIPLGKWTKISTSAASLKSIAQEAADFYAIIDGVSW